MYYSIQYLRKKDKKHAGGKKRLKSAGTALYTVSVELRARTAGKGEADVDTLTRHRKIWKIIYGPLSFWLRRKFNYTPEIARIDGPCIVIPNHVTNFDPILVSLSFPDNQMYYVASEHIFRLGLITKLLDWLVSPIPRRKGAGGADAVLTIMRRIRDGASIGLFAEGDSSWDGRRVDIFPSTGKLVRASGATLVTYRLEGGHLSLPRWGRGVRRGAMRGHVVGVYPPEQLKAMKPAEIVSIIDRDIYEDAFEREAREQTRFVGRDAAENLETLLYICPECGQVGRLRSAGVWIRCDGCGFSRRYTETGAFVPAEPFADPGEWDRWQREKAKTLLPDENGLLFSDTRMRLQEILPKHRTKKLGEGTLELRDDALRICGETFPLAEIGEMSVYGAKTLVFTCRERYFEIKSRYPRCARKYLDRWKEFHAADEG